MCTYTHSYTHSLSPHTSIERIQNTITDPFQYNTLPLYLLLHFSSTHTFLVHFCIILTTTNKTLKKTIILSLHLCFYTNPSFSFFFFIFHLFFHFPTIHQAPTNNNNHGNHFLSLKKKHFFHFSLLKTNKTCSFLVLLPLLTDPVLSFSETHQNKFFKKKESDPLTKVHIFRSVSVFLFENNGNISCFLVFHMKVSCFLV